MGIIKVTSGLLVSKKYLHTSTGMFVSFASFPKTPMPLLLENFPVKAIKI